MKNKNVLGIDIGGSGIKGALVDLETGELATERIRIATPQPATPEAVADTIEQICSQLKWKGAIGCGFPGVVQNGVAKTAANIDKGFIDLDVEKLIAKRTGCSTVAVLNDADAASIAEMKFGAGRKEKGVVMLFTVGTGIGVVLFSKKKLVPNCELGHLWLPEAEGEAEKWMSDAARKNFELEWDEWMNRIGIYLRTVEDLFWPDLMIIGGGFAKKMNAKDPIFGTRCRVVAADLKNEAGIVGAALAAAKKSKKEKKEE